MNEPICLNIPNIETRPAGFAVQVAQSLANTYGVMVYWYAGSETRAVLPAETLAESEPMVEASASASAAL